MIFTFMIFILNFAISFWNAYVTGKSWVYTKKIGGFPHFMNFVSFLMSGIGFSWCFLIPLCLAASHEGWFGFNEKHLGITLRLGYLIFAPLVVLLGLFIWIDSICHAWREKSLLSVGVAGYNTYAQISNTIDVFQNIGPIFDSVKDFFTGSKDEDSSPVVTLIIGLIVGSIIGGFLLTTAIVVKVARNESKKFREELYDKVQK